MTHTIIYLVLSYCSQRSSYPSSMLLLAYTCGLATTEGECLCGNFIMPSAHIGKASNTEHP